MGYKKYVLVKDGKKVSREIKDLGLPMHVTFFKNRNTFKLSSEISSVKEKKDILGSLLMFDLCRKTLPQIPKEKTKIPSKINY